MKVNQVDKLDLHSPAIAQFVANRILEVIAFESYARQPWSRRRIAQYISESLEIDGALSETTLGRFLSADHSQEAQTATLAALINFLLFFEYVLPRELTWAEADLSIRSGLSLERFFKVPDNESQRQSYRDFAREYNCKAKRGSFLAKGRLHLTYHERQGVLCATEVLSLFRATETGTAIADRAKAKQAMLDHKALEFSATGPVLVKAGLFSLLLKTGNPEGFDSIIAVPELHYVSEDSTDDEGEFVGFLGQRNAGWTERLLGKLKLAEPLKAEMPKRLILAQLTNDPQYSVHQPAEKVDVWGRDRTQSSRDNRYFFDNGAKITTDYDDIARKAWEKGETPTDKLLIAKQWQDIDLFTEALALGADPNALHEDGTSLIMGCAKGGQPDFIEALLATGQCRVEADERGFPPSYHAGLMARRLAGTTSFDDVIERYQRAFDLLHPEEMRQGCKLDIKPEP